METIPISLAKSQMILANSIFRPDSLNPLPVCGKGTKLTDQLISHLLKMGIQSIDVESPSVDQDEEKRLREDLDQLEYRFKHLQENPLMMHIKNIYKEKLTCSVRDKNGETKKQVP